ncbi:LacI family transcriptional regulator [bacterium]|nr:LacI family transcriptional regulator [bacterium]
MSNQSNTITIREVASDARVSTATVSRALNEPWRVKTDTRNKVNASVVKLGYTPNPRARLLARGNSGTICFLLCNRPFIHSVHAEILQGASREADAMGVQVVYATCTYSPDALPSDIEMPRIIGACRLVDGIILAGTNYPNMMAAIDELDLPYVVFGTNLITESDVKVDNGIYVDDVDGGYQATVHLLSLGHRKIRFIGDTSLPWYRRRYAGFAMAMAEAGLDNPSPIGYAAEGELVMGFNAVNDLYENGEEFTALFIGGDMGAYGAMKALLNRGVRIPEEVSVVGFNDEEISQLAEPPLTTIRAPKEDVGAQCIHLLNDVISSGSARNRPEMLSVQLVLRLSTARPAEMRKE